MYFLLNLSHYVKSYGQLYQFLAFFTMPTLQIWPCHVTQEANFKKIYLFLILDLISEKVTKFVVEKLSTSKVICQKPHGGGKHPASAFRVKRELTTRNSARIQMTTWIRFVKNKGPEGMECPTSRGPKGRTATP